MFTFLMLCCYLAAIFIRPHEIGNILSESKIIRTMIIITFISWVIFQKEKAFTIQIKVLFAFCGAIAISSVTNGWAGGAVSLLISFIPAAVLPMLMCSNIINTHKRQLVVMFICLIAAMLMIHNGYSQHLHPDGLGWAGTKSVENGRITYMGIFNDPNDLGMFLVMTLPFAFYFKKHGGGLLKIVSIAMIVAIFYGVVLTNSRGSLLGLLTLASFYVFLKKGIKKTALIALVVTPFAVAIMSFFRTIEQGESAQGRVDAWYQGFLMFFSNPFLGVGQGNFTEYNSHTAHNSYVLVLGELGFVGYTLWLVILSLCVVSLYRAVKWFDNHEAKNELSAAIINEISINRALLFSFVGFMSTAFFLSRSYTILFFIFCGMAIACNQRTIKLIPELTVTSHRKLINKIIKLSVVSIVVLYVIVKILL